MLSSGASARPVRALRAGARTAACGLGLLGFCVLNQCGDRTFDLLPAGPDASMAGSAGVGGTGGFPPPPCGVAPCPDASFECPPGTQCTSCDNNHDCQDPEHPMCSPVSHLCVECIDDSDCGGGFNCNDLTGRCARACIYNSDCTMQNPLCDGALGVCVDCIVDSHCRGQPGKPYCSYSDCVECYDGFGCGPSEVCISFHCQHP